MCIVFTIHEGNIFNVMTYGMTKALCRLAADYGNKIAEAILGSKITPATSEPTHLSDHPEGWEQDTLCVRLRKLVHGWRENELEIRTDSENYRDMQYRELLLEVADEVEKAMNET
jgi:hypothetical protein